MYVFVCGERNSVVDSGRHLCGTKVIEHSEMKQKEILKNQIIFHENEVSITSNVPLNLYGKQNAESEAV